MTEDERQRLIEQVAGAFREVGADGTIRSIPAWHDLDEAGRIEAYALAQSLRRLEAAVDPHGLSTTTRRILSRLRR